MLRSLAVTAAALILGAADLTAQQPPPTAVRTQIQDFVRAYVEAHNKADATQLMEAVKRDPGVTSISDGEITRGWEAIRTDTDELTGRAGTFSIAIGTMDVVALGTAHASVVAPTTLTVATTAGATQVRGAITIILERGTAGWKVIHEHFSTRPAQQQNLTPPAGRPSTGS